VIYHEDLDTLAAPHVFPFVAASLAASRERYSRSIGEARLMVGDAIRMMARAPKSRASCHFAAAIGLSSVLEDFAPTIPDYALDMHTTKGKAMGRGLDHFRQEGARLIPPPTGDDPYEDEALPAVGDQAARVQIGLDVNEPSALCVNSQVWGPGNSTCRSGFRDAGDKAAPYSSSHS
jgi:hypothetical protein